MLFNQLFSEGVKIKDLMLCYIPGSSTKSFDSETESESFVTSKKSASVESFFCKNRFHRAPMLMHDDDELIYVDDLKNQNWKCPIM